MTNNTIVSARGTGYVLIGSLQTREDRVAFQETRRRLEDAGLPVSSAPVSTDGGQRFPLLISPTGKSYRGTAEIIPYLETIR